LGSLPRYLLPGGACDFSVHLGRRRSGSHPEEAEEPVDLEVDIVLWVWVAPPDEDASYVPLTSEVYNDAYDEESDEDDDSSREEEEEGAVQVSAKHTEVPDNALPWAGVLRCPGMEEVHLDGKKVGPIRSRRLSLVAEAPKYCPLAGLTLQPKLPKGLSFRLKDAVDREAELQGACELFRLAKGIPLTLGFVKPLRRKE